MFIVLTSNNWNCVKIIFFIKYFKVEEDALKEDNFNIEVEFFSKYNFREDYEWTEKLWYYAFNNYS